MFKDFLNFLSLKHRKHIAIIRDSGLWDEKWYLSRYPEAVSYRYGALWHYVLVGALKGYDPSPGFSTIDYLNVNTDVGRSNINPLVHYLVYGSKEGRRIFPSRAVSEQSNTLPLTHSATQDVLNKGGDAAVGFLEGGAVYPEINMAVVFGWVASNHDTATLIDSSDGKAHSLDISTSYTYFRDDVDKAVGNIFDKHAGFITLLKDISSTSTLKLMSHSGAMHNELASLRLARGSKSLLEISRWLFSIQTPLMEFHRRVTMVDIPILEAVIKKDRERWGNFAVKEAVCGNIPKAPMVSIIVPLYGRTDFVEHQLLGFFGDTWLLNHTELIYVLDDPRLLDAFSYQAESLYRLYRYPFRWIHGGCNRGYSGANNLGASYARGQYLLFMNSDVFPQSAGWLEPLVRVLELHPNIGAVGPRLTFADGSIQHAGIELYWNNNLGIWINHHPYKGIDSKLDPNKQTTINVHAVTGACLLVRHNDFTSVGGWDTDYLIGDFEDSDLCFKLRAAGLDIAYAPEVQLTHLERQSLRLIGEDDFRMRVTIYNAVRHQSKWHELIECIAGKI